MFSSVVARQMSDTYNYTKNKGTTMYEDGMSTKYIGDIIALCDNIKCNAEQQIQMRAQDGFYYATYELDPDMINPMYDIFTHNEIKYILLAKLYEFVQLGYEVTYDHTKLYSRVVIKWK